MMSKATYSLFVQEPKKSPDLYDRIDSWLSRNDLKRFRIAVAFARWDGLGLITSRVETLLDHGGSFESIYGIGNGVTTPDSLAYALYLQEIYTAGRIYAGVIEDEYANSLFHPKFYEFQYSDRTIAIVGSGNLTGAGLLHNTEIACEIIANDDSKEQKALEGLWQSLESRATPLDAKLLTKLTSQKKLSSEKSNGELPQKDQQKPYLKGKVKPASKSLLKKILDEHGKGKAKSKKYKALAKMDAVTDRPKRLYLQILKLETGGAKGGTERGVQIQLPVATLAAYFGVGANEQKRVRFRFPGLVDDEMLMHFKNNTHRVRLKALLGVPRPTIVTFNRIGDDEYKCTIVPQKDYKDTLEKKCPEQTRKGARRWGLA